MWEVLLDPKVLVTFIVTAALAGVIIWALSLVQRGRLSSVMSGQRQEQEGTVSRLLSSMAEDKEKLVRQYEAELAGRDARIAVLEKDNERLKDRVTQGGLLNLFGKGQREAISALLLENEQLHELVARQQEELRAMVGDLTGKLLDRLDRQYQESSRAVRYKQALLSSFLQQEEARQLLDRMLADGRLSSGSLPAPAAGRQGGDHSGIEHPEEGEGNGPA